MCTYDRYHEYARVYKYTYVHTHITYTIVCVYVYVLHSNARDSPLLPIVAGKDKNTSVCIPYIPRTGQDTGTMRFSFRRMACARDATTRPMLQFVNPLALIIDIAAPTTSSWIAAQFSASPIRPSCGERSRNRTPPMFRPDQTATLLSPCSPTSWPCTERESTCSFSAMSVRKRDESSAVPVPNTRPGGSFDSVAVTWLMMSTGLDLQWR